MGILEKIKEWYRLKKLKRVKIYPVFVPSQFPQSKKCIFCNGKMVRIMLDLPAFMCIKNNNHVRYAMQYELDQYFKTKWEGL
jgi:hypothetical protein